MTKQTNTLIKSKKSKTHQIKKYYINKDDKKELLKIIDDMIIEENTTIDADFLKLTSQVYFHH